MKTAENILYFVRNTEAVKTRDTEIVQSELWGKRQCHSIRGLPVDGWADIVRGKPCPETITVSQPTIHFQAGAKLLCAKSTVMRFRLQSQRTADPPCVTELPWLIRKILFSNDVFAEIGRA